MIDSELITSKTSRSRKRGAFTISELLLVVGIMALLMFATIPMLPGLLAPQGMSKTVSELSALVEHARNQALTTSQYSLLCLRNTKDAKGDDQLEAFIVARIEGVLSFTKDNQLQGVRPMSNVYRWSNVRLTSLDQVHADIRGMATVNAQTQSQSLIAQPTLNVAGWFGGQTGNYHAVAFSPHGYAMFIHTIQTDHGGYPSGLGLNTPYQKFFDLSLLPTKAGAVDARNPDQAALIVNGSSGHIQILRR